MRNNGAMNGVQSERKKVLLVEDEPALRDFYMQLLSNAGYDVLGAEDGEKAYDLVKENLFDLVLLDMVLPAMSGLDVLRKMQSGETATTPSSTIILTNIDDAKVIAEGISYGIRGYIVKSDTTPDKVLKTVQENIG